MLQKLVEAEGKNFAHLPKFAHANDGDVAVNMIKQSMSPLSDIDTVTGNGAAENSYDAILIDNIMEKLHGPEATKIIRKELGYSGLIVGVTGNLLPSDRNYFIACGADAVLYKPLEVSKLLNLLRVKGLLQ